MSAPQSAPQSRVLIVEDDPFIGMIEVRLLRGLGAEPTLCATMAEGLVAASGGGWALVLLDLNLPDGDGIDLLQTFLAIPALRGSPLLCVSGDEGAERWLRQASRSAPRPACLGLLRKPFQRLDFQARVQAELDRGPDALCA